MYELPLLTTRFPPLAVHSLDASALLLAENVPSSEMRSPDVRLIWALAGSCNVNNASANMSDSFMG